jgi:putative ABC transport system permease protein
VTLLSRASARWLARHRAQLLLSVLGVALGVAGVLAIDLATRSARVAFRLSAETVAGRATHQIVGAGGTVDESLVARLRTELGLEASAPVVEGYASSPLLPARALRILGVDPFSEGPFRPFVAPGALPATRARGGGEAEPEAQGLGDAALAVGVLLTTPGAVVLSRQTAERAGVGPGDTLPVVVDGRRLALSVVGALEPADPLARSGLADVLLMDISGAQDALAMPGRLTRIDLRVPEGPAEAETLARVAALLGPGESLASAGARAEAMASMTRGFDVNLAALSLLALIFGMFLIYNAVSFSVVQRRDLLGRLRALGVTRAEVLGTVLREAAWVGLAGAVVGLLAGVALARGLVRLVTRTINDLYFAVTVERVALDPLLVAKALALGLGATLLAALPPALEAASVEPRLATLRSVSEDAARRMVPRAAGVGAALVAAGCALLALPLRGLGPGFGALGLVMAGLALLTPAGAVLLIGALRPLLARAGGTIALVASRGVAASLSRTAPALAALAVAVSVTIGLEIMIRSFRATLERWLEGTLVADVYVSLPGPTASRASGTLPPEVVAAFVEHPALAGHSTYRGLDVLDARGGYRLLALELDPRGLGAFDFLEGDERDVMRRFQAGEGVLVSEPFAFRRGLAAGDAIALDTPAGPRTARVLGVFQDYGSDQGAVTVTRRLYDEWFADPGVTSLALFLGEGADTEAVVADLLARVPEGLSLVVRTNDALRTASLEVFDRTFQVTSVLRALALVVAFVGVLSALMALELERARELGVMRAWGITPSEVRRLVATQTGLLGVASGLLAVPIGLALSVVMIFVINRRSFGWTLDMQVDSQVLLQGVALALVAALAAGAYPAWRMSRASPALVLRDE